MYNYNGMAASPAHLVLPPQNDSGEKPYACPPARLLAPIVPVDLKKYNCLHC